MGGLAIAGNPGCQNTVTGAKSSVQTRNKKTVPIILRFMDFASNQQPCPNVQIKTTQYKKQSGLKTSGL